MVDKGFKTMKLLSFLFSPNEFICLFNARRLFNNFIIMIRQKIVLLDIFFLLHLFVMKFFYFLESLDNSIWFLIKFFQ